MKKKKNFVEEWNGSWQCNNNSWVFSPFTIIFLTQTMKGNLEKISPWIITVWLTNKIWTLRETTTKMKTYFGSYSYGFSVSRRNKKKKNNDNMWKREEWVWASAREKGSLRHVNTIKTNSNISEKAWKKETCKEGKGGKGRKKEGRNVCVCLSLSSSCFLSHLHFLSLNLSFSLCKREEGEREK